MVPAGTGGWSTPSTEAAPGVVCSALDFWGQWRCGRTGESPAEGFWGLEMLNVLKASIGFQKCILRMITSVRSGA